MALAASVLLASSSHALAAYAIALALLGVGWNFLFVGGTVLGWSATNLLALPLIATMFLLLVTLGVRVQAGRLGETMR